MFNYVYYKIYQSVLTGSYRDIPHFATAVFFGGSLGINILVLYFFLVKLDILPNVIRSNGAAGIVVLVFILFTILR